HMVQNNYGSIAAKVLYNATVVIGLFTAGFYSDTMVQIVERYNEIKGYGTEEDYSSQLNYHLGRIIICGVMIGIGLIEALVGLISEKVLQKLASDTHSNLPRRELKNRGRLAFVAFMKIIFGLAAIGLGAYLEHLYKRSDSTFKYL